MKDPTSRVHIIAEILALAALYLITAKLGLMLGAVSGFATLIWPPSGIALAAMLVFGRRLWPGIALGAFLANWSQGASIPVAIGIATGNTLEPLLGAWLLRRAGFRNSLDRLRDIVVLVALAAFLSTLVSATLGTGSLLLGGTILPPAYGETWGAWWFGDIMGDLIVAPLLLVASTGLKIVKEPRRIAEALALTLLVLFGSAIIFSDWIVADGNIIRPFFIFPVLMIVAVRFGQRGSVLSMILVSVITVAAIASGHGRFWSGSLTEKLLQAQIFLAVVAVSEIVLAAAISERQREKDALSASNAQRQAILDVALDSIITIDHQGRILEFNPASERIFGYSRQTALGKELAELIVPERFRDAHRKGLAHYVETGEGPVLGHRLEMPAIRSDGTEFPTELSIVPLKHASPPIFTGFIQDITDKKRSEEADRFIVEATETFATSIDYKETLRHIARIPVPRLADWCVLHILDEETQKFQTIEWACAIPEKEALLREYIDRYLSDLSKPTVVGSVFETRKPRLVTNALEQYYLSIVKDDDQLRLLMALGARSIVATPLFLRNKSMGVLSIASAHRQYESTDLSLMEIFAGRAAVALDNARLYQTAQDAVHARDEFLSVASHELNTPLTSLSLQIQMLNRGIKKSLVAGMKEGSTTSAIEVPIRVVEKISTLENQSRRLSGLLDELLDLTRIRLGRIQLERDLVDLGSVVNEVVERFGIEAKQKGVEISVRGSLPEPGCWDRLRVEQIVSNLVSNAIKYGEGKPVSILLKADQPRRRAILTVKDLGLGIEPSMQDKIFERFERAGISGKKIAGLGLGLYISRQLVEAHGGTIRVESEAGQGSTFIVELPFDAETETNHPVTRDT